MRPPEPGVNEPAQDAFDEWYGSLMRELRAGDLHPALESHLSKYRKLVPSLALCLHLADGGKGPVTEAAMVRSLAGSEYLRTHAERLYGSATEIEVRSAKAILTKLRAGAVEYADEERHAFDARTAQHRSLSCEGGADASCGAQKLNQRPTGARSHSW
jgi:Protein of unknown function (DUF3987)